MRDALINVCSLKLFINVITRIAAMLHFLFLTPPQYISKHHLSQLLASSMHVWFSQQLSQLLASSMRVWCIQQLSQLLASSMRVWCRQ